MSKLKSRARNILSFQIFRTETPLEILSMGTIGAQNGYKLGYTTLSTMNYAQRANS